MKALAWTLGILMVILNLDFVLKIIEAPIIQQKDYPLFGSFLAIFLIQRKFKEDKNLKILSYLVIASFILALGFLIYSKFFIG